MNLQLHRILVVDDNPNIHLDFRKILCPCEGANGAVLETLAADLFGDESPVKTTASFEMESAFQGQEALSKVREAEAEGRPYSLAFIDVRMPPGWDGIETIAHIWREHPGIQVVICTAYSDYSWEEILAQLGETDSLVILKKPFDNVEVLQLAHTLTKKWTLTRMASARMAELDGMVARQTAELLEANASLQREVDRRAGVESTLRESEERFRKAFDSVPIALAIYAPDDGIYLDVNQSFASLCGCGKTELVGNSPLKLNILASPAEHEKSVLSAVQGGRVVGVEIPIRRRDGEIRQTLLSVETLLLRGHTSVLTAMVDVTDQHRVEGQLRQAQKMEAVGQLAAGIAHDFNNLLTVVHGYASMQLEKEHLDADVANAFTQVTLASERAAALTRQLLAFGRKQIFQRKSLDLVKTMARLLPIVARTLGEGIAIRFNPQPLPVISADEPSMEQVLMNFAVNARDAMAGQGTLTIDACPITLADADLADHPEGRPGNFVRWSIADTGCGMDSDILTHIFEPFFTTKGPGKGTGLGLSTVYGIVKQHEGWVEVKSRKGEGTTFVVYLPSVAEASWPQVDNGPAKPGGVILKPADELAVLVVEDQPEVLKYICRALHRSGFEVHSANSGVEALQRWEEFANVDLLLTDLVMPGGVSGSMLAQRLVELKPSLKVIYCSGYSSEAVLNGALLNEGLNFISKPFTAGELLNTVHQALAPGAPKTILIPAAPM